MNKTYKPIRSAALVKGGTEIKQGEIFTLGFELRDAKNVVIVPTGGQVITVKIANKLGVVYETVASVVFDTAGTHIEFTVDENIGAGKMRVELKVTDGADVLQKYPASGHIELNITASLDDIGTGAIYTVTAAEMFARIDGSETASATAVQLAGEAVVTADAVRADFDLVVAEAGASNPEIVLARGGETTLQARLDGTDLTLAETDERISTIITTPVESVSAQEIIDARKGKISLGDRIQVMQNKTKEIGVFSDNLIDFTLDRVGYYGSNLAFNTTDIGVTTSDFIPVTAGDHIRFLFPIFTGSQQYIYTYSNADKSVYQRTTLSPTENVTYQEIPVGCFYITIAYNHNMVNAIEARKYEQGEVLDFALNQITSSSENADIFFTTKNYNALGDSITQGYLGVTNGGYMTRPYPLVVKELVGFLASRNYGISGTCIASGYGAKPTEGMVDRYSLMDNNAHVISVLGGVNDRDNNVPLSTFNPDSTDKTTFYGALNVLVKGLITKYPSKVIFLMTPLSRGLETNNTAGHKLKDYTEAIKVVGAYYGLPVLDLHATSNFFPYNSANNTANSMDGLHPNQSYVENIMSRKIAGYIKTVS